MPTEPEHYGLLRSIVLQPADDAPRLVYADWLEENQRADLAELIRLECRIPQVEHGSDLRRRMDARIAELRAAVIDPHLNRADIRGPAPTFNYHRGLIETVQVPKGRLGDLRSESLFRWHPIAAIHFPEDTFATGIPDGLFYPYEFLRTVIADGVSLLNSRLSSLPGVQIFSRPHRMA